MGCVYLVTNRTNGKQYVGMTRGMMEARRKGHEKSALKGGGCHFQSAIRKYGRENFEWDEVYSNVSNGDLGRLEIECITWYGTRDPNGYNLTDGGDGVVNATEETRRKISESSKKKWQDPQYRVRMSAAHKGKLVLVETRRKLSLASSGRKMPPKSISCRKAISDGNKGKKHTIGTRIRMSQTHKRLGHKPPSALGQKRSSKTKARMSEAQNRPEVKAKREAARLGYKNSEQHNNAISAGHERFWQYKDWESCSL